MEYQYAPKQSKRADVREKLTQESLRADLFEANMRNSIAVVMNSKEYELETKKQSLQVILDKLLKNKAELSEKFYEDTLDDVKTKIAKNDIEITRRVIQQNKKKSALMEAPKGLLKDIHSLWKENSVFNPIDTSINLVKGVLYTIPKNLISSIVATDGSPESIKKKINELLLTKDKLFSIIRHADNMEDINLKNETLQLLKNINKEVEALELELFSQGFERATKKKKRQYAEKNVTTIKKGKKKFEFVPEDDFEYAEKIKKSNKIQKKEQTVNDIRVEGEDELFTEKVIQSLQKYDFDEVKYIQKLRKRLDAVEKLERGDDIKVIPTGIPGVDINKRFKNPATRTGPGGAGSTTAARRFLGRAGPIAAGLTVGMLIYEHIDDDTPIVDIILDELKSNVTFTAALTATVATKLKDILTSVDYSAIKDNFLEMLRQDVSIHNSLNNKVAMNGDIRAGAVFQPYNQQDKMGFYEKGVTGSTQMTWNTKKDIIANINDIYKYAIFSGTDIDGYMLMSKDMQQKVLNFAQDFFQKNGVKLVITSTYRSPTKQTMIHSAWLKCHGKQKSKESCEILKKYAIKRKPAATSIHSKGNAIDISSLSYNIPNFDTLLKKHGLNRPFKNKDANFYDPEHVVNIKAAGAKEPDVTGEYYTFKELPPENVKKQDLKSTLNKAEKDQTEAYYRKITEAARPTMKGNVLVNPSFEQHTEQKKVETELDAKREKEGVAFNRNERLISIKSEIFKRDPGLNYDESNKLANKILDEETKKGELFVNIKRNIELENPDKRMVEILSIANSSYDNMVKDVSAENFNLDTFTKIYSKTSLNLDSKYEKNHKNISIEAMNELRREKMSGKYAKQKTEVGNNIDTVELKQVSAPAPKLPIGQTYSAPDENVITPMQPDQVIVVNNNSNINSGSEKKAETKNQIPRKNDNNKSKQKLHDNMSISKG